MSRLWAIFFHGQKVSEKVPSFYQVKKAEILRQKKILKK